MFETLSNASKKDILINLVTDAHICGVHLCITLNFDITIMEGIFIYKYDTC